MIGNSAELKSYSSIEDNKILVQRRVVKTIQLCFLSLFGRVAAAPEHVGCHIVFPRDIGLFVRRAEPFIYKQNASFRVL